MIAVINYHMLRITFVITSINNSMKSWHHTLTMTWISMHFYITFQKTSSVWWKFTMKHKYQLLQLKRLQAHQKLNVGRTIILKIIHILQSLSFLKMQKLNNFMYFTTMRKMSNFLLNIHQHPQEITTTTMWKFQKVCLLVRLLLKK